LFKDSVYPADIISYESRRGAKGKPCVPVLRYDPGIFLEGMIKAG
jgi:hypothetical protein